MLPQASCPEQEGNVLEIADVRKQSSRHAKVLTRGGKPCSFYERNDCPSLVLPDLVRELPLAPK